MRPQRRRYLRDSTLAIEGDRRQQAAIQYDEATSITMKTDRPETNAELHESFEPLRTAFALLALLLGLIAAMHF